MLDHPRIARVGSDTVLAFAAIMHARWNRVRRGERRPPAPSQAQRARCIAHLILALAAPLGASEAERWEARDKAEHAIVGCAIGVASGAAVRWATPGTPRWQQVALAMAPVVAAAVGKELYDRRHADRHDAEARDAVATIAGGAIGVAVTFTF